MTTDKTATVRMEEGYMRLTLGYGDPQFKGEICQAIARLEQELEVYPEVIHRREGEERSFTSIEFSGDEYICSRTCGNFIESLIQTLEMKDAIVNN